MNPSLIPIVQYCWMYPNASWYGTMDWHDVACKCTNQNVRTGGCCMHANIAMHILPVSLIHCWVVLEFGLLLILCGVVLLGRCWWRWWWWMNEGSYLILELSEVPTKILFVYLPETGFVHLPKHQWANITFIFVDLNCRPNRNNDFDSRGTKLSKWFFWWRNSYGFLR